jgi:hypothetical protein
MRRKSGSPALVSVTSTTDRVQYGGEIGLVARPFGEEPVATPQGQVRASRYHIITPHYAGSVFYDSDQSWVKALIELKGQTIEYALAT